MDVLTGVNLADIMDGAGWIAIAILVITRKLIWHTDLRKEEKKTAKAESEKAELQRLVYVALGVAEKLTVAAEATNEVLTRFPDPAARDDDV